jgi:MFS family permease
MSEAAPARTTREPGAAQPTAGRARLELFIVSTGALLVSLSQSVLVPVLAILPQRLHTSASNVEWLLTSTFLVGAVAVPLFGRMGDLFGKRRLLIVALGALAAGSLIDALTSNVPLLIVGRALQGASLAAIPLGISLLSSLLPRERVRSAIALISAMLGVGGALGLPLAGLVAEHANFHVLFWITAVGGALSLIATIAIVPRDTVRGGGRVDVPGALLMSGALVALLLPLAEGDSWGWTSARTLGLLAGAVVLFGVFVALERRVSQPLVDLKATTRRPIVLTNLASLLFGFALFASLIGTASYVQAPAIAGYGFGSSIVVAGLCLLPSGLLMLLLAPVAARLIGSIGANRTLSLGAAIVAAGWLERIFATGSLWEVIVGSTIVGAGTGIGYASMPALINANTPAAELAAANGLNSLARSLGSSLASAVGGSLLTVSTITIAGAMLPSLAAYRSLFATCAAVAVLAAVAALFVPHDPRQPDSLAA